MINEYFFDDAVEVFGSVNASRALKAAKSPAVLFHNTDNNSLIIIKKYDATDSITEVAKVDLAIGQFIMTYKPPQITYLDSFRVKD